MRRWMIAAIALTPSLASIYLAVGIGRAYRKVDEVKYKLDQSEADVHRLNEEANSLVLQVRGLQELYANAEKYATANGHEVSKDGKLEMFTWRNGSTGQICAHWCVHKMAGDGQCNEFGPDRCIP